MKDIQPGEQRAVTFVLETERDLYLVNRTYVRVVEPGNFTVSLAGSSDDKAVQVASWFEVV